MSSLKCVLLEFAVPNLIMTYFCIILRTRLNNKDITKLPLILWMRVVKSQCLFFLKQLVSNVSLRLSGIQI